MSSIRSNACGACGILGQNRPDISSTVLALSAMGWEPKKPLSVGMAARLNSLCGLAMRWRVLKSYFVHHMDGFGETSKGTMELADVPLGVRWFERASRGRCMVLNQGRGSFQPM